VHYVTHADRYDRQLAMFTAALVSRASPAPADRVLDVGAGIGNADFVVADAQTHDFTDGEFTLIVSQFGLLFFDDPEEAFANLRRSLALVGRLSLEFLLGMGMVRGLLGRLADGEREQAVQEARSALAERHEPGVGVTLGAAGWLVSARN
jgi:SAM-dependent methyltransferase